MTAFCCFGLIAKAQFMVYEPLPLPNQPQEKKESTKENSVINAYAFSNNSNAPIKVKLKIATTRYGINVVAYKKLTDETWMELGNFPYQAGKVSKYSEMAEYFEYEVYIPALQSKVYF